MIKFMIFLCGIGFCTLKMFGKFLVAIGFVTWVREICSITKHFYNQGEIYVDFFTI